MGNRSYRGLRVAIAGCLIASLAGCTGIATGVNAVGPPGPTGVNALGAPPGPPTTPADGGPAGPVRVLQLNLCNSGIAACYTGRSVAEAVTVIRTETPDLVTLNEVCQDDVSTLERALGRAVPGGGVVSAFQAARDRETGEAYRCSNGQQFGNGIVSRRPLVPGSEVGSGIYPMQDPVDPEERSWVCLEVATPAVAACTTHLSYITREVTVAQCRHLFGTIIEGMRARDGAPPLVLGGDLNLGPGNSPGLRSCLPAGSTPVDDGNVQLVVATPEFVVDSSRTIELRETDHPGLLVTFVPK
jgi:hypothetical protein